MGTRLNRSQSEGLAYLREWARAGFPRRADQLRRDLCAGCYDDLATFLANAEPAPPRTPRRPL